MRLKSSVIFSFILVALFSFTLLAEEILLSSTLENTAAKKKVKIKEKFAAVEGSSGEIIVTNGLDNWPRVNSLVVRLNGKKIIAKKQVNNKVGSFKLDVTLKENNNIVIISRKTGAGKVRLVVKGNQGGGGSEQETLDNIVGYGDSLLAGFIDGTLMEDYQVWNFGSKISEVAGKSFVLPLIYQPGNPSRRAYIKGDGTLGFLDDTEPGTRIDPEAKLDNFSVPGTTVWASKNVKSLGGDPNKDAFQVVLGGNKTLLQSVVDSKPSLVLFWVGSNDVLGMVTSQDVNDHTNINDFKSDYRAILRELKNTDAKIVAANIPDITTVAYLIDPQNPPIMPTILKQLVIAPAGVRVPATTYLEVASAALKGSLKIVTLTPDQYLTQAQLSEIRAIVIEFNEAINSICSSQGIPLVDIYSVSTQWHNGGINVAGDHLTTKYLGGVYSLDGIHPTYTTHALIANMFINRINQEFGTELPQVDVNAVYNFDPNQQYKGQAPASSISSIEGEINFDEMINLFKRIRDLEKKTKAGKKR